MKSPPILLKSTPEHPLFDAVHSSAMYKDFELLALMLTLSSLSLFALIKIVVYDKNGEVPVVSNLLLQYGKNQRPINFSIADEN